MIAQRFLPMVITGLIATSGWGCAALLGPTCLAQQHRGTGAAFRGEVAAGEIVAHQVRYETEGSQNDANLTWDGYRSASPPRIKFYATRLACTDFQAPPAINTGACALLASAGWTPIGPATGLIVTHGRGNPEVLGATAEYKIWVVGDPDRSVHYTVDITWFYGPDC